MKDTEYKSSELKIEYKHKSMSSRINNVFSQHNKPVDHEGTQPKFRSQDLSVENPAGTILSEYLFKENVRKEKNQTIPEEDILDRKLMSKQTNSSAQNVKELDEIHQ